MKKAVAVFVLLLIIGALVGLSVGIYKNNQREEASEKEDWQQGEYEAYFIREKMPADIIWFGQWDGFEFEIPIRFETEITKEALKIRDGYSKAYIVINDLEGDLDFSDEEWDILFKYLLNDSRYNFAYIGTDKLAYVVEKGGYDPDRISEDDMSAVYLRDNDSLKLIYGCYVKSDKEIEMDVCVSVLLTYQTHFDKG